MYNLKAWTGSAYGQQGKEVLRYALPSVAEMASVAVLSAIDAMMVGALGKQALAVVGLTMQPRLLILCIFLAMNVGITSVTAQKMGKKDTDAACRALCNALWITAAVSIFMTLSSVFFAAPVLHFAGGKRAAMQDASALEEAVLFFRISTSVLPFQVLMLAIGAALRGCGRGKEAFYINLTGNGVKIASNFVLIYGKAGFPSLGTMGAAWATVIGMGAGCALAFLSVGKRKSGLTIYRRRYWKPDRIVVGEMMKISGNTMLEQLGTRIGFFLYGRMIFSLGTTLFAANQISQQITTLTFSIGDGFAAAGTALLSRAVGEKKKENAVLCGRVSMMYALIVSVVVAVIVLCAGEPIARAFIGPHTEDAASVIRQAVSVLRVLACFIPFQITALTLAGCLRGLGDNGFVTVVSVLCAGLMRPVLVYAAVYLWDAGLKWIWAFSMAEMTVRFVLMYFRFRKADCAHSENK